MEFEKSNVQSQLEEVVLPFWLSLEDHTYGGFYGKVAADLSIDRQADKSAILMTRYLWALSAAYTHTKNPELLSAATQTYQFIAEKMLDKEYQGIYWSVTHDGQPANTQKHIYVQSFAIYALSEYYRISKDPSSLDLAIKLFELIESQCYMPSVNGYHEEFTVEWEKSEATVMGPKGQVDYFSTNAVLHLLEAYTNFYTVYPQAEVLDRLSNLLTIFKTHIIAESGHCRTEFDHQWQAINADVSYAHDIETAWLLYRATEVIGQATKAEYLEMINRIVKAVVAEGLDAQGIILDHLQLGEKSHIKQWWSLAESVIGFQDAYSRTADQKYQALAQVHWQFIQQYLFSSDQVSEWLPHVDEQGQVVTSRSTNMSDGWKGPYHTVRMYVELLNRLS